MTGETRDQIVSIALDRSLQPLHRIALIYLASLGPGEHPISAPTWETLLFASRDKSRQTITTLLELGLMVREHGGRYSDLYRLSDGKPSLKVLTDGKPSVNRSLDRREPVTQGALSDGKPSLKRDVVDVVKNTESNVGEEDARELEVAARDIMEHKSDLFNGGRDSIRDYVATRVPEKAQRGYLWTLVAIMESSGLRDFQTGRTFKPTAVQVGEACRELLATDELAMRAPEGDIRNLKTKLNYICKTKEKQHDPDDPADPNAELWNVLDKISK